MQTKSYFKKDGKFPTKSEKKSKKITFFQKNVNSKKKKKNSLKNRSPVNFSGKKKRFFDYFERSSKKVKNMQKKSHF